MSFRALYLSGVLWLGSGPVASAAERTIPAPEPPPRLPPQPLLTAGDPYPDRLGPLVPDYFKLQTGGFLGIVHVSLGWSAFEDVLAFGGGYGYAPEDEGVGPYHSLTATLTVRPLRINPSRSWLIVPLYVGGGLLGVFGERLFFEQPDVYPPGYYQPNAAHGLAFAGLELAVRDDRARLKRHGLFVEVVTINQYLDALIQNRSLRLLDAFSVSLGYRAML